jgi:hypothetical protein
MPLVAFEAKNPALTYVLDCMATGINNMCVLPCIFFAFKRRVLAACEQARFMAYVEDTK